MNRPHDEAVLAAASGRFVPITNKTPSGTSAKLGNPRQTRAPPERLGYSIPEFCAALGISVAFFYELRKVNTAPRTMILGTRQIISVDEAKRWCAERTAASNPEVA
jgi:predicted DNA-binding transcriptional regulator AlpA